VPTISDIRILSDPSKSEPAALVYSQNVGLCHQAFTPQRWASFKQDLTTHLSLGWDNAWWQGMLFDVGFNASPAWGIIGNTIANAIPYNAATAELLPFIDIILLIGIGGFIVWYSFGIYPVCGYFLLFGNNFLSSYTWTLGSFCRHFWIFFLIAALCSLKLSRHKAAGAFLAMSTALRIFRCFLRLAPACRFFTKLGTMPNQDRNYIILY